MEVEKQQILVCEKLLGWTCHKEPSDEEMKQARDGTGPYKGCSGYPIGGGPLGGMQFVRWTSANGIPAEIPPLTLDWLWECAKVLPKDKVTEYHTHLYNDCGGMSNAIEASAIQRLAALVATLQSL